MMIKIILTIFFLSIVFCDLKAQVNISKNSISDSIELVKALMRKSGSVNSYSIGYAGEVSQQFQRFVFLITYLNTDEFLELTKDTSICLRIYAYAGLTYNRYKKIATIKDQFQHDSTLVPYMAGCLGGNVKANRIVSNLKKWYRKKTVEYALKQHNDGKSFWYTNFVFRK